MLIRPALRLTVTAFIAIAASSCATDPLKAVADQLLRQGPAARPAGAVQMKTSSPGTAGDGCHLIKLVVPTDVDTAYARVMSRLRFRTMEERKRFAEAYSMGLMDEGFRHIAQAGSYYRMADLVGWHDPGGARQAAWLEVELSREGPSRTNFTATYCIANNDLENGNMVFRASVERRLRESVR